MALIRSHSSSVVSAAGLISCSAPALLKATSRPECVDGLLERRLHVLRTGHVTPDCDRAPAGLLDQAGRFLVGLLREVGDDQAGACARKR
jgi:hypothetical protein